MRAALCHTQGQGFYIPLALPKLVIVNGDSHAGRYLKFIAVSLPGRDSLDKESGQSIVKFTSDIKNLVILIAALGALMGTAFAFSKHRTRPSRSLGEQDLGEIPLASRIWLSNGCAS